MFNCVVEDAAAIRYARDFVIECIRSANCYNYSVKEY
jgi:hypothetical protein